MRYYILPLILTTSIATSLLQTAQAQCGPGSGGSGDGSTATPLDASYSAGAAYSVRKVYDAYAGSAMKVRRSSDDATQDIGFSAGGGLDVAALETFCTGADCFVNTWYDQSGNGKDASQSTKSKQPQVYDSADGLVQENDRPALLFDGDDYLTSDNVISGTTGRSFFSVHRLDNGENRALYSASASGNRYLLFVRPVLIGVYTNGSNRTVPYTANRQYLFSHFLSDGSGLTSGKFHTNSISLNTSGTGSSVATGSGSGHIGAKENGGKSWKGTQQELLVFTTDESSNRETLESNINNYFGIYAQFAEEVPFQNSPALLNPTVVQPPSNNGNGLPTVNITTNEAALLEMLRALEDLIAADAGTEPVRGNYAEMQLVGGTMTMVYNMDSLATAVQSLQTTLSDALSVTVVNMDSVAAIGQQIVSLYATVTENNYPLQDWGFILDTSPTFSATPDTVDVPFTPAQTTFFATSETDTGSYYLDHTGLTRYTKYYVKPYAADCREPYYGDTLSFTTLPDIPSGLTLDTSDVTSATARLLLYVDDAGGKDPDSVGFMWDATDFATLADASSTLLSDSSWTYTDPDSAGFAAQLTGLTRYTDYYFNAYADNHAGRGNDAANMTFKTKPELPSGFTLDTAGVTNTTATLKVYIDDDGGQAPTSSGFAWDTNDFASLADAGSTQASDNTLTFADADSAGYTLNVTGLTRYTDYYFNAYAENIAGRVNAASNMNFKTLPDIPSGLTLDTSDVTSATATLKLYIDDAGGQGPDSAGFMWDTNDFASLADANSSQLSDNTLTFADADSAGFTLSLTGLTRFTDYYFNAFADNLAGRGSDAVSNKSFKTKPEAPTVTSSWDGETLTLTGKVTDLGGDNGLPLPSAVGLLWGTAADLTGATPLAATYTSADSTFEATIASSALDIGERYYGTGFATNEVGTSYSDTISFETAAEATTWSEVTAMSDSAFTFKASFDYRGAVPTAVGFKWGTTADLASALDTVVTLQADSTASFTLYHEPTGPIYYASYVTNGGGTSYGDTLLFNVPIQLTDLNIRTAVDAWISDPTAAEATYGHISDWQTWRVTNMIWLFMNKPFNEDISGWDMSSVTNMESMFFGSLQSPHPFNQDISGWDVSSVTNMRQLFNYATSFDQDLSSWDVSAVKNMERVFYGATAFNHPLNDWDVSEVTNMQWMFGYASDFNQDLSNWNVGNVTNMGNMFYEAISFNGDINGWDIAEDAFNMFKGASSFNKPINDWDVSAVTNMYGMFEGASAFNQAIGTWDVSAVESMGSMFSEASSFNQEIGNWNVGNVTNMSTMFLSASSFNQDISDWDVSSVTAMDRMFTYLDSYNPDLSTWDVSSVKTMEWMFNGASSFNQNIGNWDVSSVTNMMNMLQGCTVFNQDIGGWDVSSVTNMKGMLKAASAFNQDLSQWNVSQLKIADQFLMNSSSFSRENYEATLAGWSQLDLQSGVTIRFHNSICNTTDREYIENIFGWTIQDYGAAAGCPAELPAVMTQAADSSRTSATLYAALLYDGSATISATGFKWGQQPDLSDAQDAAGSATSGAFNAELTGLDFVTTYYYTSYATNTEGTAFGDTLSFTTVAAAPIILSNPATDLAPVSATIHGKITDYGAPDNVTTGFRWGLQADLSNAADTMVTIAADSTFAAVLTGLQDNTTYFFSAYATNATETVFGDTLTFTTYIPITNLNIQSAVNLWTSDEDLALSTYGHISDWDVSNVTLMYDLFQDKSSFNEDISNWDVGRVINMSDMFKNATAFNQDISSWDVSEVTRIDHMFYQATSFNQPLNVWDVSSVTDMEYMFAFSNFDQDISGWDVSSVTKMNSMFAASIFNQNISSWDVSSVTNMSSMFNGSAFNQPLNAWDVGAVTDMSLVFANSVFDQDISNWNLSAVESMAALFASSAFNQDISGWDVSAVTNMNTMFKEASSFNQDITGWNVSSVKNMSGMFEGHSSFNQEIGAWDVSAVTNMSEMFSNATSFNQDISSWDVGSVTDMKRMFAWATTFNQDLSGWDVSAVSDMEAMFRDAYAFNQDLSSWCVPLISSHPFAFAYSTPTVDLPVWGTCPVEMIITAAEVSDGESSSDAALALTFTSSRSTANFDETDISVTNGTISSFAGTGNTYTATFTPTVEGECTVDVPGSAYTDALGNENTAADQFNWTYDITGPTMTITASEVSHGDTSSVASLSLTFTSSESTSDDFAEGDVTVTNGTLSSFTAVSATVYTATFTPAADGACTINIAGSTFTDAAGNNNTAADEFNWVKSTCAAVPSNVQGCDAGSLTSLNYQGYDYRLVEIDGECWFAENLRSEQYNNGDAIPGELTDGAWSSTNLGAQSILNNDASNLAVTGRLYNWYAVNTGDLCPTGWHVPTDNEFADLSSYLGNSVAAGKMKSSCWDGTNESGFSALAGGYRGINGAWNEDGIFGFFWSSSPYGSDALRRGLYDDTWPEGSAEFYQNYVNRHYGYSVRCLRDPGDPDCTCVNGLGFETSEDECEDIGGTWTCD